MNDSATTPDASSARRREGPLGGFLVGLCACILTVTILGSATYLGYRLYTRQQLKRQVRDIVESLENRSPAELAERGEDLRRRPKLAKFVLPELLRSLGRPQSEQQLSSTIQMLRIFVDDKRVRRALVGLTNDPRESVSAGAVHALAETRPSEEAAEILGRCLAGDRVGSVVDAACGGLFALGEPGRAEMERRLADLSTARKCWIVGYVDHAGGPMRVAWLEMMRRDSETSVRSDAEAALAKGSAGGAASAIPVADHDVVM